MKDEFTYKDFREEFLVKMSAGREDMDDKQRLSHIINNLHLLSDQSLMILAAIPPKTLGRGNFDESVISAAKALLDERVERAIFNDQKRI